MGLITAVEDQLSLSDLPKPASDHQAAAVAEDAAGAMHSTVEIQQQQEQTEACPGISENDQQPHDRQTPKQLHTHTCETQTGADDPHDKGASSENQDTASAAAADAGAEAAADEPAACTQQEVRARHCSCSCSLRDCFVDHAFCCYCLCMMRSQDQMLQPLVKVS